MAKKAEQNIFLIKFSSPERASRKTFVIIRRFPSEELLGKLSEGRTLQLRATHPPTPNCLIN